MVSPVGFMFIFNSKRAKDYTFYGTELQELEKSDSGELQLEDEDQLFRSKLIPTLMKFTTVILVRRGNSGRRKSWQIEPELEENVESGKFRIPDFIKIVFRHEEELERTITLAVRKPAPSGIEEEPK